MPATINGTSGFGGNLTGNVTGNADTSTTATKLSTTTGDAPTYACRAWVNFDGTTVTNVGGEDRCTVRASGNVSKVVRNATGRFTVHFTTTMPDTSYCIVGTASVDGTWGVSGTAKYVGSEAQASQLVGSCVIGCFAAPNMSNATIISAAFFR